MNDVSLSEHAEVAAPLALPVEHALAELEQRVQTLEATVAQLRDTRQLEERITERIATQLPPPPEPAPTPPLELIGRASTLQTAVESSWLLVELAGELRGMFAMLFDGRYHMAWVTRVTSIVLVVALLTSSWWFPLSLLPMIGGYVDKLLDLALALVLFVLLTRETRRYRDWRASRR